MLDKIPQKRFIDSINDYFPKTTFQFKGFISEAIAIAEIHAIKNPKKQRQFLIYNLACNLLVQQAVIPSLVVWNVGNAFYRGCILLKTTIILPFKFSENKSYWVKTALRIVDYSIAAFTTPLTPIVNSSRIIAGMIKPSLYFGEIPLLNDRLEFYLYDDRYAIADIPAQDTANANVHANRAFVSSLYNYSKRWGLISSSQVSRFSLFGSHSKGFFKTRKLLGKQRDDRIEEKYRLLIAFNILLSQPEKFKKNEDIIKFIEENFRSPKQNAALKMFIKKNPKFIIALSGIKPIQVKKTLVNNECVKMANPLRKKSIEQLRSVLHNLRATFNKTK